MIGVPEWLRARPRWSRAVTSILALLVSAVACADSPGGDYPVLNENVRVLHAERMIYPLAARLGHVEGAVILQAAIDSQGHVNDAVVLSGPKALLRESAEALKRWTFASPRSSKVVGVFWFRFQGLCELPCTSGFEFYPPNVVVITIGEPVATE